MSKETIIFFPKEDLTIKASDLARKDTGKDTDVIQKVASVCRWWFETNEPLNIATSGSTGTPKKYRFERAAVETSIRMTTEALGLKEGTRALLAIDPAYIGGRMVILRALYNGMNLICTAPAGNPLKFIHKEVCIDFASFVPLQVENMISNPESADKFRKIECVLIGGAPVGERLAKNLKGFSNRIFQTFGMTETLSHIALKNLTDAGDYYEALPGVNISADARGCLIIEVPALIDQPLVTNDLIEQKSGNSFRWLGRIDRQINSGGIKISPEVLEKKCETFLGPYCGPVGFFFDWQPDELLGQKVVLVLTGNEKNNPDMTELSPEGLRGILERYEIPKEIYRALKVYLTPGGKPDRKATLNAAIRIWP